MKDALGHGSDERGGGMSGEEHTQAIAAQHGIQHPQIGDVAKAPPPSSTSLESEGVGPWERYDNRFYTPPGTVVPKFSDHERADYGQAYDMTPAEKAIEGLK